MDDYLWEETPWSTSTTLMDLLGELMSAIVGPDSFNIEAVDGRSREISGGGLDAGTCLFVESSLKDGLRGLIFSENVGRSH